MYVVQFLVYLHDTTFWNKRADFVVSIYPFGSLITISYLATGQMF